MKKINYNGSIAEDARLVKKHEWLSFTGAVVGSVLCVLCLIEPITSGVANTIIQFLSFVWGGLCFVDFGRVAIKRKGATRRLNNLVDIVSDKKDLNIKEDIEVVEAELMIDNLKGYYEVLGDYIFIKNTDGTSSIIREFCTEDLEADVDLKEEYKHFLMDLRNSMELNKVVQELDNVGEFPIVGEIQKKELK